MNIFITILTILFIAGIGYLLIFAFRLLPSGNKLLALACSYGLGVGLISLQLFIYSQFKISWQRILLIFPWLVFVVIVLIKNRKRIHLHLPRLPKFSLISSLLILGIILSCCYVVFEALLRPAYAMDTWGFWLFEAKAFFLRGNLDPNVYRLTNIDYPPVMNLFETFIYIMIGKVDDTAVLLTSSAFYIFLALLFFTVLKKRYGTKYALLFTFLLLTTQTFVRQGGRLEAGLVDLPIGYYAFICLLLLLEYIKKSEKKTFILLNIFLSIISLIKFDGIPIAIIVGILAFYPTYKKKLYNYLPIIFLWVLPIIAWQIYKDVNHIKPAYFIIHTYVLSLNKATNAFIGTFLELINIKSWNVLWVIYFFSLFVFGIKKNKELFIINVLILSQLFIYLFLYIFNSAYAPSSSIERLLVHVAPMALFYLAIVLQLLDNKFLKSDNFKK